MPDWNALRRRAYTQHQQLRVHLAPDAPLLPPADGLLDAAEKATDVDRRGVPAGDSLLAGAHAVLDRDIPGIWYANGEGVSRARQRFAQAHEFAHYWLHPEIGQDACIAPDTPDAFAPPELRLNATQVAEGYSSKERREAEANLFAAELLLPAPVLRRLFTQEGWSASRIAAQSGLSLSCVLSQLMNALLQGGGEGERGRGGESNDAPVKFASDKVTQTFLNGRAELNDTIYVSPFPPLPLFPSSSLDASQQQAAHIAQGPVLVDAGPGTGKTRTLIARIVFLLTEKQVAPENILALTFSNKAAEEMRTRLRAIAGDVADRVWIGTFHAFGMELLRKEGHALGLSSAPELLDLPDAIMLLHAHLDRLGLRHLEYLSFPMLPFADILACISRAKDELQAPDDYARAAQRQIEMSARAAKKSDVEDQRIAGEKSLEVARVYGVYQELLRREGKLDFGDLLMRAVELLDAFPAVRARWQAQYPHILADEYQDINRASAQLVQRMAGNGRGLWAVGDLRQAIYRFRGASSANVRDFERDFPGGQRVRLTRNYRSLPPIVALFGAYAARMDGTTATFADWQPQREAQVLTPHPAVIAGGAGAAPPAVTLAIADDEEAQADGLAAQIREYAARGTAYGEQVILCSTHRQATRLALLLGARGIETQHRSGLLERDEVKDLLALLSLASEPEGTALRRVACFEQYAVPADDVLSLLRAARGQGRPFPGALALAADLPGLSAQGRDGLALLWQHIRPLLHHGSAWAMLTGYLFETSDYLRPLLADNSAAGQQKRLAINELLAVALRLSSRFEAEQDEKTSQQTLFLNYLRFLMACGQEKSLRVSDGGEQADGVRLMTVHQSKGLEFPVVYLPNMIKGQFPPNKHGSMVAPPEVWTDAMTLEDGEDTPNADAFIPADGRESEEEEDEAQCLFFVALSRARDALILSRPLTWNGKTATPSPLLQNCEPHLTACGAQRVAWTRPLATSEITSAQESVVEAGGREDLVTFSRGATDTNSNRAQAPIQTATAHNPDHAAQQTAGAEQSEATEQVTTTKSQTEAIPLELLTISASAAEQYRRCPRQYYYQRVLRLPTPNEGSPYLAYHQSLQAAVVWMQTEHAQGRAPSLDAAHAQLEQEWREGGEPLQTAHGRVLKAKAQQMLTGAHQATRHAQAAPSGVEMTAHLEHGAVRVRVDHVEDAAGGELRLVDYKTNRDKDDHLEPRLALARHAARQEHGERPIQILLGYLQDDEQIEVKEKAKLEAARVEKYNEALKGIRDEQFNPTPGNECARCPYFLVCPF